MLKERIAEIEHQRVMNTDGGKDCIVCLNFADKIIAEIPEITEEFCIQNQLEWGMREDITGFQFLCDAINKKIRGEK